MTMKQTLLILPMMAALLAAGCKGDKGDKGDTGPQGNANVRQYNYSLNLSDFAFFSAMNAYGTDVASVPAISSTQAVLSYIYIDPAVDNYNEWVAMPFTHYFNTGNAYNVHSYSVDGTSLWIYIRNSTGVAPYSPMSGTISYRTFVITSSQLGAMESEHVNLNKMQDVLDYFYRHDIVVEAR